MLGDATNKQLRVLLLISITLSLVVIGVLVYSKKTIQLQSDSEGRIFTGDMRVHITKPEFSKKKLEIPKS